MLGRLRVELGERLGLADPNVLAYVWVNRFPMYQWDAENGRWDATHNPFSGVVPEDEALLVTASGDPAGRRRTIPAGRARALQYDLALNGWELGGGSIRIHRRDLLERSFLLQGQSLEGMREKFGAVLDAFEYGAPPHGGIALGIDRWAALLAQPDATSARSWRSPRPSRAPTRCSRRRRRPSRASTRSSGCGSSGVPPKRALGGPAMDRPGALAAIGDTPVVRLERGSSSRAWPRSGSSSRRPTRPARTRTGWRWR